MTGAAQKLGFYTRVSESIATENVHKYVGSVVTLSVIKSLNVIIITLRGENATLCVIKLNFITHRGAIANLNIFITLVIIITFRVGLVRVRKK